jgi:hypothetical protein
LRDWCVPLNASTGRVQFKLLNPANKTVSWIVYVLAWLSFSVLVCTHYLRQVNALVHKGLGSVAATTRPWPSARGAACEALATLARSPNALLRRDLCRTLCVEYRIGQHLPMALLADDVVVRTRGARLMTVLMQRGLHDCLDVVKRDLLSGECVPGLALMISAGATGESEEPLAPVEDDVGDGETRCDSCEHLLLWATSVPAQPVPSFYQPQ